MTCRDPYLKHSLGFRLRSIFGPGMYMRLPLTMRDTAIGFCEFSQRAQANLHKMCMVVKWANFACIDGPVHVSRLSQNVVLETGGGDASSRWRRFTMLSTGSSMQTWLLFLSWLDVYPAARSLQSGRMRTGWHRRA